MAVRTHRSGKVGGRIPDLHASTGHGSATAFVDLDQVGFIAPGVIVESIKHQLKAADLAAVWRNYAASGATHLVVVGPAGSQSDLDKYIEALPAATVTVARLHADPEKLTRRIMLRSKGQGWARPGDPILGQLAGGLSDIAQAAIADDVTSAAANIGDAAVDTTSSSVEDAAEAVLLQRDGQVLPHRATQSRSRNDRVNGREPAVRFAPGPAGGHHRSGRCSADAGFRRATHSRSRIGM